MVKNRWRISFRFGIRTCYILSAIIFLLSSFLVYFFSEDSKVKVLVCTGNYYYSDQEIFSQAHIGAQTRLWLMPTFQIQNELKELELIDSVNVVRSGGRLEIQVTEKKVIGYYVDKDKNYALTDQGKSIAIASDDLAQIIHFPLLSGFTKEQRKNIAEQFRKHEEELSLSVIEKMAEIIPYESSYDSQMLQITMQDGNTIYTTLESLYMVTKYDSILNQLEGKNVCLILDRENSAIEKINCDQMNGKDREKEDAESEKSEETKEDTSTEETSKEEVKPDTTEESAQEQESTDYLQQAQDWQQDASFGLQYSATLDLYYDPGTGTYYRWNDTTLSFDVVN